MADLENNMELTGQDTPVPAPETAEDCGQPAEAMDTAPPEELHPEQPETAPAEESAGTEKEPAADTETPAEENNPEAAPGSPEPPEDSPVPETEPPGPEKAEGAHTALSGIRVAMALCDRVMETVGLERFHGGVRPDNISVRDDLVHLGTTLQHNVGEFTPQELEYMAPELFWDGIRSPAADVYSVGLVLYSIYNYGRLPFWPVSGAITPNARASALQKRMSDEPITPPAKADAELSAVILRALAFRTEERWQDVRELKEVLSTCDESSSPVDISLAMSGLLTRSTEPSPDHRAAAGKSRNYYDDKEIPAVRRPRRRRNLSWLWLLLFGILIVGAAILLLLGGNDRGASNDPNQLVLEDTPSPEPLLTPTPSPEVTATPEPTERPRGPQYAVYVENVSWERAVERCRELGGTLAIPSSEEEYNELVRVCTSARVNYVWLGASRQADGNWMTPDGELVTFFNWGEGEPSRIDGGDGAAEDYLLMWRNNELWQYNDSREDPLKDYAWLYGGSIGFVCRMW